MSRSIDITAVITGHREGVMAGVSIRSFLDCIDFAKTRGVSVEVLGVLDRPDRKTRDVFSALSELGHRVIELDFGDQGQARNCAVERSSGKYVAFLDGDDLWSLNWLVEALKVCEDSPGKVICHPEYNWFFDQNSNVLLMTDDRDPFYQENFLRFANYWDALCLAPRQAHLDAPYCARDVAGGFAYEDWHWNCETVSLGYRHWVATDTIHFKRRRKDSQTLRASAAKVLQKRTRLLDYGWQRDRKKV